MHRLPHSLRRGHAQPARAEPAGRAHDEPAPQRHDRHDRHALAGYRVAAAALLAALAGAGAASVGLEGFRLGSGASTTAVIAYSVVSCGVVLGLGYYLGRTRGAPGSRQRLNNSGLVISVIPFWGLAQIPLFTGLTRLTKRRLLLRNVAITVGSALVCVSLADLVRPVPGSAAVAVLQVAGVALAITMSQRIPTTGARDAGTPPGGTKPDGREAGTAPPRGGRRANGPQQVAGKPGDLPAADEVVDVSALAAAARRAYWVTGSVKAGALVLAVAILTQGHSGPGVGFADAGILALYAVAVLLQEDRIRPAAGVVLALGLVSAICLAVAALGLLKSSGAWAAVFLWAICPLACLRLYRAQRRSAGLSDAEVQAVSRVGHLPARGDRSAVRRVPPPGLLLRGVAGMLCAIVVVLAGLFTTIASVAGLVIVPGFVQAGLDKLYASSRRLAERSLAGTRSGERVAVTLALPAEPGMWQLHVRGDVLRWGKLYIPLLSPMLVPFEEFLRARLEVYGNVRTIPGAAAHPAAAVAVLPVGVRYSPGVLDEVTTSGSRALLLPVEPIGNRPLRNWPVLARQVGERGIALPALTDPVRAIAVLHHATGKNVLFTAERRDQWGYLAVIYEVLRRCLQPPPGPVPRASPSHDQRGMRRPPGTSSAER